MNRNGGLLFLGGLILGMLAWASLPPRVSTAEPGGTGPTSLLGKFLPDIRLLTMGDSVVQLKGMLGRQASLVVVLDEKDCLGCGDFGTELKILARELPHLQQVVIGEGADTALLKSYFRQVRLSAFLDRRSQLVSSGLIKTPLVAVVDQGGRILFADERPGSEGQLFSVSRLLPRLTAILEGS